MRITTNTAYRSALASLERANTELARRQAEISSGRRVNVASDDPSSAATAISEHAAGAALDSYMQAADSVKSRLDVLDTVLGNMIDQLTAVQVAAHSGRGTTVAPLQREAAAREVQSLRDALVGDFSTSFHGVQLFSGTAAGARPYRLQPDGTIGSYEGDHGVASIDVDRQSAISVTFDGDALARGSDAAHVFDLLDDLAAALRAGDDPAIRVAVDGITRATERIQQAQSRVGSDMARLGQQRASLTARKLGSTARLSRAEDANLAEAASALQQADTARQATLGAIATISRQSLLDYLS